MWYYYLILTRGGNNMELKEKLKRARNERNVSQQSLADAIFVSRSAVAKWESGLGVPCAESMEALEKYFNVEKGFFLTDCPDEVIVDKNIKMRKTKRTFLVLSLSIAAVFLTFSVVAFFLVRPVFAETSFLYTEAVNENGFDIGVNPIADTCYAAQYTCTAFTEKLGVTVPDECNGIPVRRLGGCYGRGLPQPFCLSYAEFYMNAPEGSPYTSVFSEESLQNVEDAFTVVDIPVVLNIGENIETVEFVSSDEYYPHVNEDGSVVFYHVTVYINCSEYNEFFYSKNGKLYEKKTNKLITDFDYSE